MTPRLIDEGLYTEKLQRFLTLFPKDQILVQRYDLLKNNPAEYLRRIYEFLAVGTDFESPMTANNTNAVSLRLGRSRTLHYVSKGLVRLGSYGLSRVLDRVVHKELPQMRRDTRDHLLREYYLDEFERLESLLGWDLTEWREDHR